jgi:hypothetical protein
VTAAAYLTLVGIGLLPQDPDAVLGPAVAMAVGFFVGGLLVGLRWMDAPTLHAVAITLVSMVVWFVGSLALPREGMLLGRTSATVLGLVLLQLVASVLGGWAGRRVSLGKRAV